MVMVPGSVEDERMFSTLKYIRNPQRNTTCAALDELGTGV